MGVLDGVAGPHVAVLRGCSWLSTEEQPLALLKGPLNVCVLPYIQTEGDGILCFNPTHYLSNPISKVLSNPN